MPDGSSRQHRVALEGVGLAEPTLACPQEPTACWARPMLAGPQGRVTASGPGVRARRFPVPGSYKLA